jgi:predicted RNA-binding protein YlxR (DUF448 family)
MARKYKCLITGELLPKGELYRFVLSPDNRVVFDPEFELEGQNIVISKNEEIVRGCLLSNFLDKEFNSKIDLTVLKQQILQHFYNKLLTFIALAKKSGKLLQGKMQVEQYIRENGLKSEILIQASDSSLGEKFKQKDSLIIEIFNTEDLSQVFGDEMVKYAIVTGDFVEYIAEFYNKYIFFKSLNDR